MKNRFIVLAFLATLGFSFKIHNDSKNFFEGKWMMCKHICNEIETTKNVCIELVFFADGSGELIKPEKKSKFNWELNNETIDFHFINDEDKKSFISADSIFTYQIFDRGKIDELRIIGEDKSCEYILSKEKK